MKILFHIDSGVISYMEKKTIVNTQVGRVLCFLSERAGTVVSKEEILEKCWEQRGVVVSLNALRQTMYRLRKVLEEIGAPEEVLLTKGRDGYLFQNDALEIVYEVEQKRTTLDDHSYSANYIQATKSQSYLVAFLKRVSHQKKHITLLVTLISPLLFALGFYLRFLFFITPLEYHQLKDYYSMRVFVENNSSIDTKKSQELIDNYLMKYNIVSKELKNVYISHSENENYSFIICTDSIELSTSSCQSVLVIKDIK